MSDKLAEWLRLNNMSPGDLALMLFGDREHRPVVFRYIKGHRIPRREIMDRIISLTNGFVTPNDFYRNVTTERPTDAIVNNTRKQKNETVADISKPARQIGSVVRRGSKR
jgi:hypothetical protein